MKTHGICHGPAPISLVLLRLRHSRDSAVRILKGQRTYLLMWFIVALYALVSS
jgi:hypothetical protein